MGEAGHNYFQRNSSELVLHFQLMKALHHSEAGQHGVLLFPKAHLGHEAHIIVSAERDLVTHSLNYLCLMHEKRVF